MEQQSSNLVTLYSEVKAKTVSWLWYPYIPIGKITILAGDLRTVKHVKSNLVPAGDELFFTMTKEEGFRWGGNDSNAINKKQKSIFSLPKNKHELASILITDALVDGDTEAQRIQDIMKKYRIGTKTMQETKEKLGITSYRKMRKWYWHMEQAETNDGTEES